jgi:hypothetical protein
MKVVVLTLALVAAVVIAKAGPSRRNEVKR